MTARSNGFFAYPLNADEERETMSRRGKTFIIGRKAMARFAAVDQAKRYRPIADDEWEFPKRRGYRMACCDCGLVHELDFALIPWGRGKKIIFRARRHEAETARLRKGKR